MGPKIFTCVASPLFRSYGVKQKGGLFLSKSEKRSTKVVNWLLESVKNECIRGALAMRNLSIVQRSSSMKPLIMSKMRHFPDFLNFSSL
jgi:hypothetical protein